MAHLEPFCSNFRSLWLTVLRNADRIRQWARLPPTTPMAAITCLVIWVPSARTSLHCPRTLQRKHPPCQIEKMPNPVFAKGRVRQERVNMSTGLLLSKIVYRQIPTINDTRQSPPRSSAPRLLILQGLVVWSVLALQMPMCRRQNETSKRSGGNEHKREPMDVLDHPVRNSESQC